MFIFLLIIAKCISVFNRIWGTDGYLKTRATDQLFLLFWDLMVSTMTKLFRIRLDLWCTFFFLSILAIGRKEINVASIGKSNFLINILVSMYVSSFCLTPALFSQDIKVTNPLGETNSHHIPKKSGKRVQLSDLCSHILFLLLYWGKKTRDVFKILIMGKISCVWIPLECEPDLQQKMNTAGFNTLKIEV